MPVTVDNNYEVTVTPEKWQRELYKALRSPELRNKILEELRLPSDETEDKLYDEYLKVRELIEDSRDSEDWETLNTLYDKLDDTYKKYKSYRDQRITDPYSRMYRLYQIYKTAQRPSINYGKERAYYDGTLYPPSILKDPYYYIADNILNINSGSVNNIHDYNTLISELSHPIQERYGKNSYTLENINKARNQKKWNDTAERYSDPTHYEYEAHTLFQPQINEYILNEITPTLFPIKKQEEN